MSGGTREQVQDVPALRFRMGEVSPTEAVENADGEANGNCGIVRLQFAPWNLRTIDSLGGRWFKGQPFAKTEISDNGQRYCIHYGELFTKYGCVISCIYSRTNSSATVKSQAGDILFPASDVTPEGLGRCSVVLQSEVILGGDLICFRQDEVDSEFLGYAINNAGAQIIRYVTGTTVRHSSADKLKMVHVFLPVLKHEQQKLGSFFRSLDSLIDGREKALGKLESLKKAMLQKMFPQGGAKTPELRFKGFEGEWEVKKRLGEVCAIRTGHKDVNEGCAFGQYPFFTCSKEVYRANTYSFDGEALLIAGNGEVGNMHYCNGKFEAYQRTYVLMGFKENISYIQHYLNAFLMKNLKDGKIGSSMPYIVLSQLSDFQVHIPSLPEQEKIGAYFSSLDALLAARREEVAKLRDLKKALLERMFV